MGIKFYEEKNRETTSEASVETKEAKQPVTEQKTLSPVETTIPVETVVPTLEESLHPLLREKGIDAESFFMLTRAINAANNQMQHLLSRESFSCDDNWISNIESAMFSIEKIAKSPKAGLKEDRLVVPVEKARKVGSETIRHLSSHTSNIRGFNEEGMVRPSKVLTIEHDEEKLLYENRVVFTLIKRLILFVEMRVQAISAKMDTFDVHQISHATTFKMEKSVVDYKLQLNVKTKNNDDEAMERNKSQLARIKNIQKRLSILQGSAFFAEMSKGKLVTPPIMKTNILVKNVDYNNCYKLWLFIFGYTEMGFFVDVSDQKLPIETNYFDDLTLLTAVSVKLMLDNNIVNDYARKFKGEDTRRLKLVDKISYNPDSKKGGAVDKDNLVNQFYVDKLKELVNKAKSNRTLDRKVDLDPSFATFYKELTELNNKLFEDVLKLAAPKLEKPETRKSQLAQKKQLVKDGEERLANQKLLTKLMTASLAAQKTKEDREVVKLEKSRLALEKFLEQEKARKLREEEKARIEKEKKAALRAKKAEAARIAKEKKAEQVRREKEKKELEKQKALQRIEAEKAKAQKLKEEQEAKEKREAEKAAALKAKQEAEEQKAKEREAAAEARAQKLKEEQEAKEKREAEKEAALKAKQEAEEQKAKEREAAEKEKARKQKELQDAKEKREAEKAAAETAKRDEEEISAKIRAVEAQAKERELEFQKEQTEKMAAEKAARGNAEAKIEPGEPRKPLNKLAAGRKDAKRSRFVRRDDTDK